MHRMALAILFIAFLSLRADLSGGAQQSTSDRDQVAAATAAWGEAYNSRDPARITALYDPEAVFWGTTAKTISPNPERVLEYFKNARNQPDARVTFGEQYVRVYGEIGISTGSYTFSNIRDGKEISNPARYTFVFRNRNGKWLIVDHHSSRVP